MSCRYGVLSLALIAACRPAEQQIGVFNTPPNVSITAPTQDATYDEGSEIAFAGRVSDDGDVTAVGVGWTSDLDGVLLEFDSPDADGNVTYATINLTPGNHLITLTAVDADAEAAEDTVEVTVVDLPEAPEIEILRPADGETARAGEPFEFEVVVADAQDAPADILVEVESDLDGPLCMFDVEDSGRGRCEGILTTGDTHELTFRATDTDNTVTERTKFFVVIALTAIDNDGDGFTEEQLDCDDADKLQYPGAPEVANGEDDDCDGKIDEGTPVYDDDGDGLSEVGGDCDDTNPLISPSAKEACDTTDNNCDTVVDEPGASGCTTYYADKDRDTYGNAASSQCLCGPSGDFVVLNTTDCYDESGSAKPGQTAYFQTSRGDGSFDYNCDNTQQKELTDTFSCSGAVWVCVSVDRAGWTSGVPGCGSPGWWATACSANFSSCYASGAQSVTQRCR